MKIETFAEAQYLREEIKIVSNSIHLLSLYDDSTDSASLEVKVDSVMSCSVPSALSSEIIDLIKRHLLARYDELTKQFEEL